MIVNSFESVTVQCAAATEPMDAAAPAGRRPTSTSLKLT